MTNNTTGRLDPESWEDADITEVRNVPALPPHYFTRSRLDDAQLAAGPERALYATETSIGSPVAWDAVARQLVDGEEPIGV